MGTGTSKHWYRDFQAWVLGLLSKGMDTFKHGYLNFEHGYKDFRAWIQGLPSMGTGTFEYGYRDF